MQKKKGLFIVTKYMKESENSDSGVCKKIYQQFDVFKKHYDIELIEAYFKRRKIGKILSRVPLFPNMFSTKGLKVDYEKLNFIYFRYDWGDLQTVLFFCKLKKKAPKCKILIELPTYPLDLDKLTTKWHQKIFKYKHVVWSKFIKNFVDRAVVHGDDDYAYGIPTIKTSNGIDTASISVKKFTEYNEKEIRLISVSNMIKWHGIDRLIKGMYKYKDNAVGQRKIYLHLVGKGREEAYLRELVKRYDLEDEVVFHGYKFGDELAAIHDQADIGIELLGIHRNKTTGISSSLKSREYFAKGLPFVSECQFKEECNAVSAYILSVRADESPINMEEVIAFYDSCYKDKEQGSTERALNSFARDKLDINKVMEAIFEYIDQ